MPIKAMMPMIPLRAHISRKSLWAWLNSIMTGCEIDFSTYSSRLF